MLRKIVAKLYQRRGWLYSFVKTKKDENIAPLKA